MEEKLWAIGYGPKNQSDLRLAVRTLAMGLWLVGHREKNPEITQA